ncbi:hypothetical protein BZG36_00988 [Bifiguratus adelaidae]|uniref:Delta(24(24(1)))-sterol reductase n=1 Tax=Bifiguratus adelaidae TaxID=1938954 RepID=A0A261Y685_9FUNG|nr:hypothetical protein BZG36_00988 [Bifiguratus adelaidae]
MSALDTSSLSATIMQQQHQDKSNAKRNGSIASHLANGGQKQYNKAVDDKIDSSVHMEFGGPVGTLAMMIFFPVLMFYFWICLEFHNGHMIYPSLETVTSLPALKEWVYVELIKRVIDHAPLTTYGSTIYLGFIAWSIFCAYVMPGPRTKGLPVPSLGYQQLEYHCNGLSSWYVTLALSAVLHITGVFPLQDIVDNFGPILSCAVLSGYAVTLITYFWTVLFGTPHRMSGKFFYDLFMGAPLNPRIGKLDLKMWAEIRVPWVILFYISLSAVIKQYEMTGHVTAAQAFMLMAHFLYVNACSKGEECIPTTWDIFYEKWGFMLIFWNLAGVPFTYCHATIYLLNWQQNHGYPMTHHTGYTIFVYTLCLVGYYIWDTGNSQKNRFRMELAGTYIPRRTFPQLPWGHIKNPKYIKTEHGAYLLTSGWWGIARKIHYTADLMMALSWGLICGFDSFIPYFYVCFFLVVLVHRVTRDMERCAKKYGKDWERYCKEVPWIFIPFVY